ncbi:Dak1 domain-containing protein [Podospora fimiseda]|uniref:3-hydroxyisobutyryl-coenzyme A hydrolase n=1 Tax=Podospora fimiseda TaxID=252190 RepID=A0AAN7BVL1_9PEZI|nr:Dak1 domain-containing protein [Podospora fimiseda]
MSTKHFINDASRLVTTALESLTYTNPGLTLDRPNKIIYRRPGYGSPGQRVSIISGGGSGHEPSFAGMVGKGLLNAAVAGTIFASPSAEQIRAAIMARVDHGDVDGGVLVTVMNYTGDVLNFGMAVEKAKAAGVNVEMVVVGDDVGVGRAKGGKVGRRGIAGTVLVHKISGALAMQGRSLKEVAKVAKLVADNLVSIGASLEHVHVPGRTVVDSEALKNGEVEIGMGIHNEQGSSREIIELPDLVHMMLRKMLDRNDADRAFVNVNSNEVVLLLNNLGGVSVLEMGGILTEVVKQLEADYNIRPVRILNGTYMTSLNSLGFSITLLNVVNTDIGGPSMIELLDAPCEAVGWSSPISKLTWEENRSNRATREQDASVGSDNQSSGLMMDGSAAQQALIHGLEGVISAEPDVTRFDTVVGDGDCGTGLRRGAEAILNHILANPLTGDVVVDVANIVPVIEMEMDGTSGALYAIFLNSLVAALRNVSQKHKDASPYAWASALEASCESLNRYTPARPGDRTLMDALCPFIFTLRETGSVNEAAKAAFEGAEGTKGMKASLGRTVYIGGSGYEQVPDPGAWGLACFFMGLAGLKIKDTPISKDDKPSDEEWEQLAVASRAAPARACCTTRNLFAMPLRAKILPAVLPHQQQQQQQQQRSMTSAEIIHRFRPRSDDEPEDVVFNSLYGLRSIELNRPKKLNALNGSMVRKIVPRLVEWSKSDMANVIVMKGAGDRAFCAGGDVAQLAQWNKTGEAGQKKSMDYFGQEYMLDHMIATYRKPMIAFMDGITMGGGVGLSIHAPLRIATERTVFAMPETTIGFFPDVGASYFLPRLPGFVGTYLALTSERVLGADVFYCGIATHYLHSTSLPALESRLAELRFLDADNLEQRLKVINSTIEEYVTGLPHNKQIGISGNLRKAIDRCFCHDSVEEILQALEKEKDQVWAKKTIETLHKRSPTAVHVTLRQMRIGKKWSIADTFKREYGIASKFMKHHDFTEGVTARLIEKRDPKWQPESLEKISAQESDELTEKFFLLDESDKQFQLTTEKKTKDNFRSRFSLPFESEQANEPLGANDFAFKFVVPTEAEVEQQVSLGTKSQSEILDYFLSTRNQKQGVKQVVEEILRRKTRRSGSGKVEWIYEEQGERESEGF